MLVWAMAHDVADGHGGHGQDPEEHGIVDPKGREGQEEDPGEGGEGRGLDPHRHEGGDGGGGPFIDVRGPHMEGRRGHLEAEAHDQQGNGQQGQGLGEGAVAGQGLGQLVEVEGAAGGPVQHGHAEEQKAAGEGAQDQIFQGGFVGARHPPGTAPPGRKPRWT